MHTALLVTGAAACFRRPEFVEDVITYEVIPPVVARMLFAAIHWTPAIRWTIEQIEVLHPIRTEWTAPDASTGGRQLNLVDPAYAIRARFDLTDAASETDNIAQHNSIFHRRAKGGRYRDQPYLGRRGLVANLRLVGHDEPFPSYYAGSGSIDIGWTLFDRPVAEDQHVQYFRPTMIDGTIDLTSLDPAALAR